MGFKYIMLLVLGHPGVDVPGPGEDAAVHVEEARKAEVGEIAAGVPDEGRRVPVPRTVGRASTLRTPLSPGVAGVGGALLVSPASDSQASWRRMFWRRKRATPSTMRRA